MTAQDKTSIAIADYLRQNREPGLPVDSVFEIRVAADDNPKFLPGCYVMATGATEFLPLRNVYRVSGQCVVAAMPQDTTPELHREWCGYIAKALSNLSAIKAYVNTPDGESDTRVVQAFHLYDLFLRDGTTTPTGETYETAIAFEAIVVGVDVLPTI